MATGIRVLRLDEHPISWPFAALREVVVKSIVLSAPGYLPGLAGVLGGLIGFADLLWPLWDSKNRALHDFVVRTCVIRQPSIVSHL